MVLMMILASVPSSAQEIAGFTLIDAISDRDIRPFKDGDTIDFTKEGGELNIRVDVRGKVGSVQFELDGQGPGRIESVAPFSIGGDNKPVLTVTTGARTAASRVYFFDPEDDAFLEKGNPFNSGQLRVEDKKRVAYMKFNVSGLSGDVQYATLKLTENGDTGSGNLRLHKGSHNNWTEENITTANAPDKDGEIGSRSGSVGEGQTIEIDVTALITGNGVFSLVIEMDDGGDDIWFGSKESERIGKYGRWSLPPGKHRLTVVPFSGPGASGTRGKARTLAFTVVGTPGIYIYTPESQYPDIENTGEMGRIPPPIGGSGVVEGDLMRWHGFSVIFDGPPSSETAKINPFLHYRLNVTFSKGGKSLTVPGFYAGDGEGGETGGKWRVLFSPPETGVWKYRASFRAGYQVNVSLDPKAGMPTACDGAEGEISVAASDKSGGDFRSADKGLLKNRGHHYLTFGGSGKVWIKGGPDVPENLFGYDGFDNTPKPGHFFKAHEVDWRPGDPDWGGGKGKRIIGAMNFIAEQGGNCIYFLPMNIGGDGKDTFPTIGEYEKTRFDHSKLEQWDIVFAHAQAKGIFLHFQLAETEDACNNYHDGGTLGVERKLYYRELIARFGHHNGLEWDIGEENDYGTEKQVQFAQFIREVDPYDHPIATHTKGVDSFYEPLVARLAEGREIVIDITAFQTGASSMKLANLIQKYRDASALYGKPWTVSIDEPQKIENDKTDLEKGYAFGRRGKLWPTYMAGGGGFEWYVQMDGGGHSFDHRIENFRDMDVALRWTAIAHEFLEKLPLLDMAPNHDLCTSSRGGNIFVLAKPGELYAVYTDRCEADLSLDLSAGAGTFEILWLDPRTGGDLMPGSVKTVQGGAKRNIGLPPEQQNKIEIDNDWACLVQRNLMISSSLLANPKKVYLEENGYIIAGTLMFQPRTGCRNRIVGYLQADVAGDHLTVIRSSMSQ